jgi:hypothetical protein
MDRAHVHILERDERSPRLDAVLAQREVEVMKPLIAQHSSKSSLWMTPEPVIEATRQLFGGSIDLDAASDEEANKRVGAGQYLTDALSEAPWPTVRTCFLNPPGGKYCGTQSLPKLFWKRLVDEVRAGRVGHAVFLAFSIEMLQTCQDMVGYRLCIPKQRLRFVPREGTAASPTHANAIVYVPGYLNDPYGFKLAFHHIGAVRL